MIWKLFKAPRLNNQTAKSIACGIALNYIDKPERWLVENIETIFEEIFDNKYPDYKITPDEARAIAKHVVHLRSNYSDEIRRHRAALNAYSQAQEQGMHLNTRMNHKYIVEDYSYLEGFPEGPYQYDKNMTDFLRKRGL